MHDHYVSHFNRLRDDCLVVTLDPLSHILALGVLIPLLQPPQGLNQLIIIVELIETEWFSP